ncbi:MAG: PfkB family carbohydrate kinase [Candidatus Diapherotrites archaeon]
MSHKKKIFVVGDTNVDFFTYYSKNLVFGEEHKANSFSVSIGGNAANFAVAMASLGIEVELVSAIGKDVFKEFIDKELSDKKIKKNFFVFNEKNGISNIFVRNDGERAIVSSKGCMLKLTSKMVWQKIGKKIKKGDWIFFGGYYHLKGLHKDFKKLLKNFKQRGVIIAFDATYDEYNTWDVSFLGLVDYFFLDEREFEKITGNKSLHQGIKFLLKNGAKRVILKRGSKGAAFFTNSKKIFEKANKVKAINTTGAGDFFNAGFVYGLINDFNEKVCLKIGNFVASQRISLVKISERKVLKFLKKTEKINIILCKDYQELSKVAFEEIALQLALKPDSVFCFAAGNTPILAYNMVKDSKLDFSKSTIIQLDEYLDLKSEKDSFKFFIKNQLVGTKKFRKEFFFSGNLSMAKSQAKSVEKFVRTHGLDFVLLGIGKNGHIAFNEPGSKANSKTRVAFTFIGKEKRKVITLGIGTILSAKKIVLLASGKEKSFAVKKALFGKISDKVPASFLRLHKNCNFIVDSEAWKRNIN